MASKNTLKGQGLDAQFPYGGNTFFSDGRIYLEADSPYIKGLNVGITFAKMTSTFHTYLMFQPPANSSSDVRWVPVAESLWLTNFMANIPPSDSWLDYPTDQSVGPVQLGYNLVPQNSFPTWSQIVPTDDSF